MPANADRNLLFGILALQMDFISRDQLVIAMNAWVFDKSRTLGQMLVRQQALSPDTHALIDTLVQKHVGLHDNDPQKSLASISPAGPDGLGAVMEALATVYDNDVQASLVHVAHARTYSATAQNAGRAESAKPDPFATTGLST